MICSPSPFKSVDTHRDLFGVKQNLALVWYLNTQIREKRAEKGIEIPILTDVPVTKTKFLESIEMRGNCVFKHSRIQIFTLHTVHCIMETCSIACVEKYVLFLNQE